MILLNNFTEKQAVNMMPVSHIQSFVCHITVLADAVSRLWSTSTRVSASNGTLTAVDVTATGVIVSKHFLNVTYTTFKENPFINT